jgi:hypothetical protein
LLYEDDEKALGYQVVKVHMVAVSAAGLGQGGRTAAYTKIFGIYARDIACNHSTALPICQKIAG